MQVGSGMAGMLIIEGPIDEVPEIAAAAEKVFVFQAPIYDTVTGKLEDFSQVGNITVERAELRHQRRARAAHPDEKRRGAELAVPQRRRSSSSST